jgi:hypothetical protein
LRFPKDEEVVVGALAVIGAAASRFFRESFFSRCSRCTGGGTGVLEAGREGAGAGVGAGDATACANEALFVMLSLSGWGAIAGRASA